MKAYEHIDRIRAYLDYLEEHIENVEKAWKILQDKCKDMKFIYDDYEFFTLNTDIFNHDVSKFSEHEFIQYQKVFYPTIDEQDVLDSAWGHHKNNNPHHWENWTNRTDRDQYLDLVHMVVDWMAMSMRFNDTPRKYYESHKHDIKLPEWAIEIMYEIFDRLEDK